MIELFGYIYIGRPGVGYYVSTGVQIQIWYTIKWDNIEDSVDLRGEYVTPPNSQGQAMRISSTLVLERIMGIASFGGIKHYKRGSHLALAFSSTLHD